MRDQVSGDKKGPLKELRETPDIVCTQTSLHNLYQGREGVSSCLQKPTGDYKIKFWQTCIEINSLSIISVY